VKAKQKSSDYGGEREEHLDEFITQGEKCAICSKPLYFKGGIQEDVTRLDHCHTSGEFRGFLCNQCNSGLGQFKDNTELMSKAIDYIKNHRGKSKFWRYWNKA
jgi:hypothetical protein